MGIDNIKVGDYVYCRETGYIKNTNRIFAYKGRKYLVECIDMSNNSLELVTELGPCHLWSFNEEFHKYFSDIPTTLTKHTIKKHKFK